MKCKPIKQVDTCTVYKCSHGGWIVSLGDRSTGHVPDNVPEQFASNEFSEIEKFLRAAMTGPGEQS